MKKEEGGIQIVSAEFNCERVASDEQFSNIQRPLDGFGFGGFSFGR
ncbi:MAG: hypothetical protein FWC53_02470 [Firmicutes bacterium]|nr:hypothetical protein [Bacillota bacterium]